MSEIDAFDQERLIKAGLDILGDGDESTLDKKTLAELEANCEEYRLFKRLYPLKRGRKPKEYLIKLNQIKN